MENPSSQKSEERFGGNLPDELLADIRKWTYQASAFTHPLLHHGGVEEGSRGQKNENNNFSAVELSQELGGTITDQLLSDLQKNTEHLALLTLSDEAIKKHVEDSALKKFFTCGLLDAFIRHAATSSALKPFVYQSPYAISRFALYDLPICLHQGENFIELYRLDTMKTTGKLLLDPASSVLFSPERRTFCIWTAHSCHIFNTDDRFIYNYPQSEESEKVKPEKGRIDELFFDKPVTALSYQSEGLIVFEHAEKSESYLFLSGVYSSNQKSPPHKKSFSSEAAAHDNHYYARICHDNRVEVVSVVCDTGKIPVMWKAPYPLVDIIWPSYEQGILVCSLDGRAIITLTTRVAYLLSRYKKITAAHSSSS